MKSIQSTVLVIFFSLALSCCNNTKPKIDTQLGADWIAALNRQDMQKILSFYADSVQFDSPNWEGTRTGKSVVQDTYSRYFASTPNLRLELNNTISGDSSLVIEYTSSGILSNPEKGTPAYMLGKKYTLKNITRFDIRNGKIIRQASYFDQVSFLQQMGFFEQPNH